MSSIMSVDTLAEHNLLAYEAEQMRDIALWKSQPPNPLSEGVATGLGGMWTTDLDVPLVFVLALRTIIKVGHCYGYTLDQPQDRPLCWAFFLSQAQVHWKRDATG
jgi:hypothetical protein